VRPLQIPPPPSRSREQRQLLYIQDLRAVASRAVESSFHPSSLTPARDAASTSAAVTSSGDGERTKERGGRDSSSPAEAEAVRAKEQEQEQQLARARAREQELLARIHANEARLGVQVHVSWHCRHAAARYVPFTPRRRPCVSVSSFADLAIARPRAIAHAEPCVCIRRHPRRSLNEGFKANLTGPQRVFPAAAPDATGAG